MRFLLLVECPSSSRRQPGYKYGFRGSMALAPRYVLLNHVWGDCAIYSESNHIMSLWCVELGTCTASLTVMQSRHTGEQHPQGSTAKECQGIGTAISRPSSRASSPVQSPSLVNIYKCQKKTIIIDEHPLGYSMVACMHTNVLLTILSEQLAPEDLFTCSGKGGALIAEKLHTLGFRRA